MEASSGKIANFVFSLMGLAQTYCRMYAVVNSIANACKKPTPCGHECHETRMEDVESSIGRCQT